MKMMKKMIAILLSMSLSAFILAGCSGSSGSSESTESSDSTGDSSVSVTSAPEATGAVQDAFSNHLDISVAFWGIDDTLAGGENDKVLKTIEDKFNVTFVPASISWDDYTEKIQLWAASNTLPDVFVGPFRTTSSYYKWATEGLLKEIPQDLSAYPNLNQYISGNKAETDTCMVDGKMYSIFRQTYGEQAETVKDRTIVYRWDLAQQAGITAEPTTWDEFRAMVQAIISKDPEGKNIQGMTSEGYNLLSGLLIPYSNPLATAGGSTFYWVKADDGSYVPAYFSGTTLGSNLLPAWNLARDMYNDGTIESDIALTTTDQAREKFLQGQSAAICYAGGIKGNYDTLQKYWAETYGVDFWEDCKYLDLMSDQNGQPSYPIWDYAWSESYFSSNVDDEKFNRILSIYDYLLSEEGTVLSHYGFENEQYTKDANGNIVLNDGVNPVEVYPSINLFQSLVFWNSGLLDSSKLPSVHPQEDAMDAQRVEKAKTVQIPEYDYRYTSIFSGLGTDFNLKIDEDFLNIMTGTDTVENMWNSIIDEYKADGLSDIITQVNDKAKELGY